MINGCYSMNSIRDDDEVGLYRASLVFRPATIEVHTNWASCQRHGGQDTKFPRGSFGAPPNLLESGKVNRLNNSRESGERERDKMAAGSQSVHGGGWSYCN